MLLRLLHKTHGGLSELYANNRTITYRILQRKKEYKKWLTLAALTVEYTNQKQKAAFIHYLSEHIDHCEGFIRNIYHDLSRLQQRARILKSTLNSQQEARTIAQIDHFLKSMNHNFQHVDGIIAQIDQLRQIQRQWQAEPPGVASQIPLHPQPTQTLETKTTPESNEMVTLTIINPNLVHHSHAVLPDLKTMLQQLKIDLAACQELSMHTEDPRAQSQIHHKAHQLQLSNQQYRKTAKDWQARIASKRQHHFDRIVACRQNIDTSESTHQKSIDDCYRALQRLRDQENLLNELNQLLVKQRVWMKTHTPEEAKRIVLNTQLLTDIEATLHTYCDPNNALHQRIDAVCEETNALMNRYDFTRQKEGRLIFLTRLPDKINSCDTHLRELEGALALCMRDLYHYQETLLYGSTPQTLQALLNTQTDANLSWNTFEKLYEHSQQARDSLLNQCHLLTQARAQIDAQKHWHGHLLEFVLTEHEEKNIATLMEQYRKKLTQQQHAIERLEQKVQVTQLEDLSFDEQIQHVNRCHCERQAFSQKLLEQTKHLQELKEHFSNLSVDELRVLREQRMGHDQSLYDNLLAEPENISHQRFLIDQKLQELMQQKNLLNNIQQQLTALEQWAAICHLATQEPTQKKIGKTLSHIEQKILEYSTGDLSTKALQQRLNNIVSLAAKQDEYKTTALQSPHYRSLMNELITVTESQRKLLEHRQQLQQIGYQLGGQLTLNQLTAPPLILSAKHAQRIITQRKLTHELLFAINQLHRNLDYIKQVIEQKQKIFKNPSHKTVSATATTKQPQAKLSLQAMIDPKRITAKNRLYTSRSGLPVEVSSKAIVFKPQSHLPYNHRQQLLFEGIEQYNRKQEFETVRQMVDQARLNQWGPLKINGGILPCYNDLKRYELLMVAVARAELTLGVDWRHLGHVDMRHSPAYHNIREQEEKLLAQQPIMSPCAEAKLHQPLCALPIPQLNTV